VAADAPIQTVETKDVERRGVELVPRRSMRGRRRSSMRSAQPGFDVPLTPDGEDPIRTRGEGTASPAAGDSWEHNEVLMGLTAQRASAGACAGTRAVEHDESGYLENLLTGFAAGDFDATGHPGKWEDDVGEYSRSLWPMTTDRGGPRLAAPKARSLMVALHAGENNKGIRSREVDRRPPSTLNLWWATCRGPLARAVYSRSSSTDPRAPDRFYRGGRDAERERLPGYRATRRRGEHAAIRRCSRSARGDHKSTGGNAAHLNPFAGGGTIPTEAQRLAWAHASDLNPVAV